MLDAKIIKKRATYSDYALFKFYLHKTVYDVFKSFS